MTFEQSLFPADRSTDLLDLTVGDLLRRAAERAPDTIALIEGSGDAETRRRWTYADLLADAEAGARALLERFEPGEHLAVWAPNRPEWALVQYSAAMAGLVLVTINPTLRPAEAEYQIETADVAGIVAHGEYRDQNLGALAEAMKADVTKLREVIAIDDWTSLVRSGGDADLPPVAPSDRVMIQFTSGTTGLPKGALLTHHGIVNAGHFICERLQRRPGDVWINPLPMFHTGGCVMGALGAAASFGTHLVVSDFDPGLILRLIEEERPVYLLAVPTMILALLEHPDMAIRNTSSLEVVSSGGSMVPPDLVRRIEEDFDVTYNMAFGQTESSSVIFMTHLDSTTEQKALTLGQPLGQWEAMVAGDDGKPLPVGEQGEICCRGWGVMAGYYGMQEETAEAIGSSGWLHTGDLGIMDEVGYTRITGRLKDMIIRGGENIFPREIEDVLITHPDVAEVAVIGVPDDRWGEVPVACIRAANEQRPTPDELGAFVAERLARHKTPRDWLFVDALPLNASGKVQKFVLRDLYDKHVANTPR